VPGSAAHTGRDEHHVRAAQRVGDPVVRLHGRPAPHVRTAARAQSGLAELEHVLRAGTRKRLMVGVGADEVDALHAAADHVFDRVAASAADADHLDDGALGLCFQNLEWHVTSCVSASHRAQKLPTIHSFIRLKVCFTEPVWATSLRPRSCCACASTSRPITVAKRGLRTTSASAPL